MANSNVYCYALKDENFKVLFGPLVGKQNMRNFLVALFPDMPIEDFEYLNTEQFGLSPHESKSNFDLLVSLTGGERIIVEMQTTNLKYFNYRAMYYSTFCTQAQAHIERERQRKACEQRGVDPYWNYYYAPVYLVAILRDGLGGENGASDGDKYIYHYRLKENTTGEDMKVELNFVFLRLDKFAKGENEASDPVDRFLWSLKNIHRQEVIPESFAGDEAMKTFYETAMLANMPPEAIRQIEIKKDMTTENDIRVAIAEAAERAAAKAMAEGLEKGMEKSKLSIAREMLKKGLSLELVSECTGISVSELEQL